MRLLVRIFFVTFFLGFFSCNSSYTNKEDCTGTINRLAYLAISAIEEENGKIFKVERELKSSNYSLFKKSLKNYNFDKDLSDFEFQKFLANIDADNVPACILTSGVFLDEISNPEKVLYFSKDYENTLYAELFDVDYLNYKDPKKYSGSSEAYLFIFENGSINEILRERIKH